MSMKPKPDTRAFAKDRDISAFLDGAQESATPVAKPIEARQPLAVPRQPKVTKIFNLPLDLVEALRTEAYNRSRETGRRVTETELVDQALRQLLKLDS